MPGGGEVCMVFYSTNKSKISVAQLEGNGKMLITACINLADSLSMRIPPCSLLLVGLLACCMGYFSIGPMI